jgi:hypothetical protein
MLIVIIYTQPNLSLYAISTFLILDSDGGRVLAKYYRPKNQPVLDSRALSSLKEQRAFEKGLWEKTKKPGGRLTPHPYSLTTNNIAT